MFLSDNLCYLEMHRTGSIHLVELLNKYISHGKIIGVHNRASRDIYDSNRYFLGSIRNPWEWYVSAWSYGCVKKGGLYTRLTSKKIYFNNLGFKIKPLLAPYIFLQQLWRPLSVWHELYSDTQSVKNFRKWLKLLLGGSRIYDIGEGFALSSISKFAGLMTYRYLVLYSSNIKKLYDNSIVSYKNLEEFDKKYNVLDYTIRNESLEESFFDALLNLNIKIDEKEKDQIRKLKRTKWGAWRDQKLNDFFDDECLELVQEKEKFIINKYRYEKSHN